MSKVSDVHIQYARLNGSVKADCGQRLVNLPESLPNQFPWELIDIDEDSGWAEIRMKPTGAMYTLTAPDLARLEIKK